MLYRIGKYQLVARLGTGGMAEVWRARRLDDPDGPSLVIKRVLPSHAHDPKFVESLRTEARLLTSLRHPGIVHLHALEEIDGQMLLVLEHVDGCDLRALYRVFGDEPPPPGLGAWIVSEACRALGHAHRFVDDGASDERTVRSILHRDISPSNVMVTRDGSIKVVDFGIAKALFDTADEQTRSRSIKGKLSYMAPEQLAGQLLSCAADVYSAGVLLHELLTGRRLFTVSSPLAMSMVHEAQVPPPSSINPAVPPVLDAVCARALAFSPTARFTDGQEMYEALAPIATQLRFGRAELAAALAWAMPAAHEPTAGTATVADRAALVATAPTAHAPRRALRWVVAVAALVASGVGIGFGARKLAARTDPAASAPPASTRAPAPTLPPASVAIPPAANLPAPPPAAPTATSAPNPLVTTARARPKAAHKKPHARPARRDGLPDGTLAPF
jgi:hypothetical protein